MVKRGQIDQSLRTHMITATATLAYIRESVPKNQKQKLIRRWVPKGGHPCAIFAATNERVKILIH